VHGLGESVDEEGDESGLNFHRKPAFMKYRQHTWGASVDLPVQGATRPFDFDSAAATIFIILLWTRTAVKRDCNAGMIDKIRAAGYSPFAKTTIAA
jgi:hypothetical protein